MRDAVVPTLFVGDEASPEFNRTAIQQDMVERYDAIRRTHPALQELQEAAVAYYREAPGASELAVDNLWAAARKYGHVVERG